MQLVDYLLQSISLDLCKLAEKIKNNTICLNCNSRFIENEYHFLLVCPKYSDLRNKYLKRYYYTWPSLKKFTNLMSVKSKTIVKNLSKFIYYASLSRN